MTAPTLPTGLREGRGRLCGEGVPRSSLGCLAGKDSDRLGMPTVPPAARPRKAGNRFLHRRGADLLPQTVAVCAAGFLPVPGLRSGRRCGPPLRVGAQPFHQSRDDSAQRLETHIRPTITHTAPTHRSRLLKLTLRPLLPGLPAASLKHAEARFVFVESEHGVKRWTESVLQRYD